MMFWKITSTKLY